MVLRKPCAAALRAVTCFVLAFAPVSVLADAVDDGRRLLAEFLTGVQSLTARFEQSLVDADDVIIEESSGTMQILRPGQFRWAYEQPYEQLLVADGLNVWSYDVDLAQVTVKPQQDVLQNTPALILSGAADVMDQFDVVDGFEDRGTVWLRLRPRSTEHGFNTVELGFNAERLDRMIFTDSLGQSTLIALFDLQINEPIDANLFRFVPPDDADVVGRPATAAANSP